MKRFGVLLAAIWLMAPGSAGAEDGSPPLDYADTSGLSQPVDTLIGRDKLMVPMSDGVRLYVEVTRPAAPGAYGTIMEISPYHVDRPSRSGTTISGGLVGYFPPRGYAVVMVDVRGTGNSEGCMDYLGARDRRDFHDVVEWAGEQPWSNGNVGIVGVSYVASTPILAAASDPDHLATIVPIAGIATMYDHEFQAGVPYFLQWAGAAGTYDVNYGARPPMNTRDQGWLSNVGNAGCGIKNAALSTGADYASGRYVKWHAERDFREDAIAADIPVFLMQGHQDGSVRPVAMEWFTHRNHPDDKLWLGQWGHQPSDRGRQWTGALHRWFDKHLLGRPVDTGPPVEVFFHPEGDSMVRTDVTWPRTTSTLTLYPGADGAMRFTPPAPGTVSFGANVVGGGLIGSPSLWDTADLPARAVFETEPFDHDVVVSGFPRVTINERLFGGRIDLIASLYALAEYLPPTLISQAAMNPELRDGIGTVSSITPGEMMTLNPPAWPTNQIVKAGSRLRLIISSAHSDKVPVFAGPGLIELVLGGEDPTRIELGVVDDPALFTDPLYPPAE